MTKEIIKKAKKKNLFNDIICPNCKASNTINPFDCKINQSGVWYYCDKCGWLDVIGIDIIEEAVKN
jgi:predicted RNA-binding Zn-ribbon protein involved in translation (DUF1610 family)